MFFCLLYLLSALSISAVAAYFSVVGLATIFPGSITPIIIMGGVLEIGKIVTAIWLHRNWKSAPLLVRTYLSFATLVLMGITSMGIFGFLSRAHIEHETVTEKSIAMAQTIDNKIVREREYIKRQQEYIKALESKTNQTASSARLDIDQETGKIKDITEQMNKDIAFEQSRISEERLPLQELDKEVKDLEASSGGLFSNKKKKIEELKQRQEPKRNLISRKIEEYNANIDRFRNEAQSKIESIENKITLFRNSTEKKDVSSQPQIETHSKNISEAYAKIDLMETEKLGFTDNTRELEAEIGPVKYVAEAIADFTGKEFNASQAVRIVIIILVLVFDPLAILLVIAANISIMKNFHLEDKNLNKIEEAKKKASKELNTIKEKTSSASKEMEETEELLSESRLKKNEALALSAELDAKLESVRREIQSEQNKLDALAEEAQENESAIEKIKIEAEEEREGLRKITEDFSEKNLELKKDKAALIARKEKLEADKTLFFTQKDQLEAQKAKLKESISSLEKILTQLNKEKTNVAGEKKALQINCDSLKKRADTQEKLIKNLKQTYNESLKNGTVKDIFDAQEIDEVVQFLDSGQKLISIPDKNKRIHQFLIPEQHKDLKHEYFHKVSEALGNIIDPSDLPHEYKTEIEKYIRSSIPEYNCLT